MCEGGGILFPMLNPSDLIPRIYDRRSLLKPLEIFGWQKIRKESKGKLFEIRGKVDVWKLTGTNIDLSNISCEVIDPGYVLIISYIPIRYSYRYIGVFDDYAFLILHKESFCLLLLSSIKPRKYNPNQN